MRRTRGRSRVPGERAGLAHDVVVAAARAVYEREGLSGLTMRAVAERLGVAPNALYSHVRDKADLVDAVVDAVLGEVELPREGRGFREAMLALLRSSRKVLVEYGELMPAFLARPTRGPNALRLAEVSLRLLARAGLEGERAVAALRVLLVYTFGFAAQEVPRASDPDGAARREKTRRVVGEHPRLRALADPLAEHPGDRVFEMGLRFLLDGIEAEAKKRA